MQLIIKMHRQILSHVTNCASGIGKDNKKYKMEKYTLLRQQKHSSLSYLKKTQRLFPNNIKNNVHPFLK